MISFPSSISFVFISYFLLSLELLFQTLSIISSFFLIILPTLFPDFHVANILFYLFCLFFILFLSLSSRFSPKLLSHLLSAALSYLYLYHSNETTEFPRKRQGFIVIFMLTGFACFFSKNGLAVNSLVLNRSGNRKKLNGKCKTQIFVSKITTH